MINYGDRVARLLDRVAEDEQAARSATGGEWEVGPGFGARDSRVYVKPQGPGIDTIGTCVIACQVSNMPEFRANAVHIARHDPARTLREAKARRDRVALLQILIDNPPTEDDGPEANLGYHIQSRIALALLRFEEEPYEPATAEQMREQP